MLLIPSIKKLNAIYTQSGILNFLGQQWNCHLLPERENMQGVAHFSTKSLILLSHMLRFSMPQGILCLPTVSWLFLIG